MADLTLSLGPTASSVPGSRMLNMELGSRFGTMGWALQTGVGECVRRVYEGQYARGHFNGQGRMVGPILVDSKPCAQVWKTPKGTLLKPRMTRVFR